MLAAKSQLAHGHGHLPRAVLTAPRPISWQRALCSSSDDDGSEANGKKKKKKVAAVVDSVDSAEAVAEPASKEMAEATSDEVFESSVEGDYEEGTLIKHDPENISTMPPVLVFPFSNRPLFPGVYQPCEVTHEGLCAALIEAKASSHPYVGVWLPKPNEDGENVELMTVTDPSQVKQRNLLRRELSRMRMMNFYRLHYWCYHLILAHDDPAAHPLK